MHLIMKAEFDEHCINLPTVNEMVIILSDKYNQLHFCDIVICSCHIKGTQHDFSHIHLNHAAYILFQYSLLFSYNDSN